MGCSREKQPSAVSDGPPTPASPRPDSPTSVHDDNLRLHVVQSVASEVYGRFSARRKLLATVVLSFAGFNSNLASQIMAPAIPEVAAHFGTSPDVINIGNSLFILGIALGAPVWGPMSDIFGRRWISIISSAIFFLFSIGTALATNLPSFLIFRVISAFASNASQIVGQSAVCDMYKPTERGKALVWFVSGTLAGPTFTPLIGSAIITYSHWRILFWTQSASVGLALLLIFAFVPETNDNLLIGELKGLDRRTKMHKIWRWAIGPVLILRHFRHPKVLAANFGASAILWNMQATLIPVRFVLNPRFDLTSPMLSGLFYLAPGAGYFAGSFLGGWYINRTVQHWKDKRGRRVPEDRLRSSFWAMCVAFPASILIYGWSIDKEKGGIPVPVICLFVQGVSQMFGLPCLNAYTVEVLPGLGSEVFAGSIFFRFVLSAVATQACLPEIQHIGIGWTNTITTVFIGSTGLAIMAVTYLATRRLKGPSEGPC